jgi:hypothetical protein
MEPWFKELYLKRKSLLASLADNDKPNMLRELTVEKYVDPIHFVFELLQNADDQEAIEVNFELQKDRLIFQHNGKPFTREDVMSISGVGRSTKPEKLNKIGRFGIGFKSVFVITNRPEVYTTLEDQPFAFGIENLIVPIPMPPRNSVKTTFALPFKEAQASKFYETIRKKLETLGPDILLFLHNLRSIQWKASVNEGRYFCTGDRENGISQFSGENRSLGVSNPEEEITYLTFSRQVEIEGSDRPLQVRVAFRMNNGKVIPEPISPPLDVYFPTQERLGLKFRLHAPFLLTDNRANVKEDTRNTRLVEECGKLLADTLPLLRDKGLLTVEYLTALPLDSAPVVATWLIRRAISGLYHLKPPSDNDGAVHPKPEKLIFSR